MAAKPKPKRMTDDEVLRFLREVRYSDARERQARRARYSVNAIAKQASCQNTRIYEIVAGKAGLNDRIRRAVENVIGL